MKLLCFILSVEVEKAIREMKNFVKYVLQKLLGFDNYLFVFSLYIINTLKRNRKEKDFLFFLKLIKEKGVILDIGANIGVMSVYLSKNFPDSQIYSFEPIPANIKAFKRITEHYKIQNVKLVETAVGNVNGNIEMLMPVVKSVRFQGLSHVIQENEALNEEGDKFTTPLTTIDSFYKTEKLQQPIIAIKIDVENYEFFVFEGAKEILEKHQPIIYCELWENQNRFDCFELLRSFNYNIMVLDKDKLCIFDATVHKTQNFFFIPNK